MLQASVADIKGVHVKSTKNEILILTYIYIYISIDELSSTIIQQIYAYDSTYKNIFDKVLIQLNTHCLCIDVVSVINLITSVVVIVKLVEHF